ncbi:MAG: T9SS type A sorting domain-containing protein, partial [Lewinellaceae bacterium]|nr:T9SS type A sorting domain-containing protein [Lewinellaceae bacterium]
IGAIIDGNEHGVGAAYFFHLEGTSWVQKQKVAPTDRNGIMDIEAGWFGYSVSISGGRAIVGAWNPFNNTVGAAYLYQLEAGIWVEKKRVTSADWNFLSPASSEFGTSVSISGDKAIIGARKDPVSNISAAGAAYLIHWDGNEWIPQPGKITADEPAADEYFGTAVSISGDWVIVGAEGNDDAGADAGSAYIFHWNGSNWVPYGQLFSDVPAGNEEFGYSVSISESRAIVGTFNGEAAYLFRWNGINWVPDTQQPKLTAGDGLYGDQFGTSVSISGDMAIVGANQYSNNSTGKAYPFLWDGNEWLSLSTVVINDPAPQSQDAAGASVSTDGERLIIGAPFDDNINGANAGAAYISATVPCGGAMRPAPDPILPPAAEMAKAETGFTLYPNPALEEVFLEFKTPLASDAEVWVYDLAGRPVLRRKLEEGADWVGIPVEQLVSGLYLVEVKSEEQVFEVKRFVKGGD